MSTSKPALKQYQTIAHAIRYIRSHAKQQPTLTEIATAVGMSEYHLQRLFTEWVGVSPKRFLQYLTKEHAKQVLQQSTDVLSTTIESGLSSPGRLHDLMVSCEAMTPGQIKSQGQDLTISFGTATTPFGQALIGWTERGICTLAFYDDNGEAEMQGLKEQWPLATFQYQQAEATALSEKIFNSSQPEKFNLIIQGTNFQIKVWEALLNIGSSQLASYSTLAGLAGSPKAQRAVGSALAMNKIGFLIPCHRVIRGDGETGQYRWGSDRKLLMQAWEAAG